MPNADLILMLECSLRFPRVLVEGVRKLYRGADGRAIFETPFFGGTPEFRAGSRARPPPKIRRILTPLQL